MKAPLLRTIFCVSLFAFAVVFNQELVCAEHMHVRMVLIVPENASPEPGYDKRLGELGLRAEKFFMDWMAHWGRSPERANIFERVEGSDQIRVTVVKADFGKAGSIDGLMDVRRTAIRAAKTKLSLNDRAKTVWWVFYDAPDIRGYRGFGNSRGGWAINRYPGKPAPISHLQTPATKLPELVNQSMIHELGHAFGLPHSGPRIELQLGNTLMGPTAAAFKKKFRSKDTRVHLNETSAAILWKHPLFMKEKVTSPKPMKKFRFTEVNAAETNQGRSLLLSGKLEAGRKPHSVVVYDCPGDFGAYVSRTYLTALNDEGKFELEIGPLRDAGKLYPIACFHNGMTTADGKRELMSKGKGIVIRYEGKAGSRTIKID